MGKQRVNRGLIRPLCAMNMACGLGARGLMCDGPPFLVTWHGMHPRAGIRSQSMLDDGIIETQGDGADVLLTLGG
jgi:hypothetical protein